MSEQSKVPARLREGIDAAKRGDKTTARRLLQQVLSADGDNELALMWMASVVDSVNERRFYLERALSINPNNPRAREALRRLGVTEPQVRRSTSAATSTSTTRRASGGGSNIYLIAAAIVAIVVIAVIVAVAATSLQQQPTPAPQVAQATFSAIVNPSATPTRDRRPPTLTALPGIVVTLDSNLLTPLPPTFTPTFTNTPTDEPTPTVTPPPLGSFTMFYSDIEQGAAVPSLYRGRADGTGEIKLESGTATGGYGDIAYDPTGQRIAFIRSVVTEGDDAADAIPQLFVASTTSLDTPTQITTLTGGILAHPSWSPDGKHIVFSSTSDGDEEIVIVNPDGSDAAQLTNNDARDFDPQFSPDGTHIVFASELNSPGFSEIYTMTLSGEEVTQLTEVPNSYAPAWSPDGARIAYVNDQQGDGDIYLMDADGERSALLTIDDSGAEDRNPVWSPDSRWILFASNRDDDQFRWFAVDLNGTVQPVTLTGRNPQSLSFVTR